MALVPTWDIVSLKTKKKTLRKAYWKQHTKPSIQKLGILVNDLCLQLEESFCPMLRTENHNYVKEFYHTFP